jgi:acetyl-CoA carboxylase carboxyl transferase subunit alpha
MKLTAEDVMKLGLIDGIIPEPEGGAHRDPEMAASKGKDYIIRSLQELKGLEPEKMIRQRIEKYRRMGVFSE